MDTMYELPSMENVRKCIITEDVVLGKIPPELIYADPEPAARAGKRGSAVRIKNCPPHD